MKTIVTLLFLSIAVSLQAQDTATFFKNADSFFKAHVRNGRVDYKAVKSNPTALNDLLKNAATIKVNPSEAATYQSFWINAYNLAVIKGVVSAYPIKSPLDIKGFFDKNTYTLGGTDITLNDIENKKLRAAFPSEARFHFVLVCAGLGCPPIIDEAYVPSKLDSQLERQTKRALNDPTFIRSKGKKVQLSQIFEWYKEDFVRNGDEISFVNKYRKEPLPENAKISYYPYDWTLNEIK